MNRQLVELVDVIARERGIEAEQVFAALEAAVASAVRKSSDLKTAEARAEINRRTGNIQAWSLWNVVDSVHLPEVEMSVEEARKLKPDAQVGDVVEVPVPSDKLGRIAAQSAKNTLMHGLRQAEKDQLFEEYKGREGEIITCTVRRFERSDVIVELEKGEGVIPASERVRTEEYQRGDRIKAYLVRVENVGAGTEVVLSRSRPEFVRRLFELEVSEIADGTVEIVGIAREAGYRTKLAVHTRDEKVDPVGACVGMRGMRVKNIVRELGGEKIDIIRWREDVAKFVGEALSPAQVSEIEVFEDEQRVQVRVDEDQLSLAIGKKGQNARLTAKLTGWKIDIDKIDRERGFHEKVAAAVASLAGLGEIGEERARALVSHGFLSPEGVHAADSDDLLGIEGFDEEAVARLKAAAAAVIASGDEAAETAAAPETPPDPAPDPEAASPDLPTEEAPAAEVPAEEEAAADVPAAEVPAGEVAPSETPAPEESAGDGLAEDAPAEAPVGAPPAPDAPAADEDEKARAAGASPAEDGSAS